MAISKKHHYVPEFLIKQFCDEDQTIWVYNKKNRRFDKDKKNPAGFMYEVGRNHATINGGISDYIEKIYSEVDTRIAVILQKVLRTQIMSGSDLTYLILLASTIKWRVPKMDNAFNDLVGDLNIENLGMRIQPVGEPRETDKEAIEKIMQEEVIQKLKKILLPLQTLTNESTLDDVHRNSFLIVDSPFPALISDNPVIEKRTTGDGRLDEFILPLSASATLVCKQGTQRHVDLLKFHSHRDLAMFHYAEKYIACKNRNYFEKIIDIYNEKKNIAQMKDISEILFNTIN